jgi:hypothetical protein
MYRVEFVLHSGLDAAERGRFVADMLALDVHPERVEMSEDGSGAVYYFDPPITVEERAVLDRWLTEHPLVWRHTESVAATAELRCEFTCLAAPVQAEGTLAGHPFYFRARGDEWSFAVSEQPDVDPAALHSAQAAEGSGWFRGGTFAGAYTGSRLPRDDAEMLIHLCAREYLYEAATPR